MSSQEAHANLGRVIVANHVTTSAIDPRRMRNIIILLAVSVAVMMTGYGIIIPVFAKRLPDFDGGVEELALMTMTFGVGQLVAAPFMGALADRVGRKPLILVGLASFVFINIGFLFARSSELFIVIRGLEGIFTAGLFPASLGAVGDIVPENRRAQWVGIVMGSYGAGIIFGPVIGGILFDAWGFEAPFIASAGAGGLAFVGALVMVPETRDRVARLRGELRHRREMAARAIQRVGFMESIPKPLYVFGALLFLDFGAVFGFAFVEPEMVFYMYEDLEWTPTLFGLVVGAYGLSMMLGQMTLGQLSDRFGRRPIIVVGLLISTTFYGGMALFTTLPFLFTVALLAGLGNALFMPASSAYFLDITPEIHRSRVMGLKESAAALGGVAGPLMVLALSGLVSSIGIFWIAAGVTMVSAFLALLALQSPRQASESQRDLAWQSNERRAMAAQAALRGLVYSARAARRLGA